MFPLNGGCNSASGLILNRTDNKEHTIYTHKATLSADDVQSSSATKLCTSVEMQETSAKVHGLRMILFVHVCEFSYI